MMPKSYFTSGFLTRASSIRELASKAGIDAAGLERTIDAMNEYARTGKDLEFGRGDAEYDRYYADPAIKPNPCLAPIAEAPFYAMRIDPGDFGTHGGLVIDTHLHFDHAGGNTFVEGDGPPQLTFPNARYVVQRGEWVYATHPNERTAGSYFDHNYAPVIAADRFDFVDGEREIGARCRVRACDGRARVDGAR
jgi:hypothetical protein